MRKKWCRSGKLRKKKWLNETYIEEQLGYSRLRNITLQYPKHLRKQRQELQECVKQPCRRFLMEDFAVQVIMGCRTTRSINFKTRLGFNQQDPIMIQKQSILTKIRSISKRKNNVSRLCFRL